MKFKERKFAGGGIDKANRLKLTDGQSVTGIFRGEPHDFYQHWENNLPADCVGRATCALCAEGKRASFRFRVNFIVKENGAYVAKVFEQGGRVYDQLRSLANDYELEKTTVKITRTGKDKNTNYTIMPTPNGQLNELSEKAISQVALLPLENQTPDGPDTTDSDSAGEEDHDEVPF